MGKLGTLLTLGVVGGVAYLGYKYVLPVLGGLSGIVGGLGSFGKGVGDFFGGLSQGWAEFWHITDVTRPWSEELGRYVTAMPVATSYEEFLKQPAGTPERPQIPYTPTPEELATLPLPLQYILTRPSADYPASTLDYLRWAGDPSGLASVIPPELQAEYTAATGFVFPTPSTPPATEPLVVWETPTYEPPAPHEPLVVWETPTTLVGPISYWNGMIWQP